MLPEVMSYSVQGHINVQLHSKVKLSYWSTHVEIS